MYTRTKEENLPILVNPKKRPKAKKGIFSSIKSFFGSTPKNSNGNEGFGKDEAGGRRGSISKDGNGSDKEDGKDGKKDRRGSISKNDKDSPSSGSPNQLTSGSSPFHSSVGSVGAPSPRHAAMGSPPSSSLPPPNHLSLDLATAARRSSVQLASPRQGSSSGNNDEDFMSDDDSSDSDLDNNDAECMHNTKINTPSKHTDVFDLLARWEMYYTGFQTFEPRDSASLVSFSQQGQGHGVSLMGVGLGSLSPRK